VCVTEWYVEEQLHVMLLFDRKMYYLAVLYK